MSKKKKRKKNPHKTLEKGEKNDEAERHRKCGKKRRKIELNGRRENDEEEEMSTKCF